MTRNTYNCGYSFMMTCFCKTIENLFELVEHTVNEEISIFFYFINALLNFEPAQDTQLDFTILFNEQIVIFLLQFIAKDIVQTASTEYKGKSN